MSNEKDKLVKMLSENKISESDYKMLAAALDRKSLLNSIEDLPVFNPFKKIAGIKALLFGIAIMLAMSLIGVKANVYFDGIFSNTFNIGIKTNMHPNFYLLLYQNVINVFVLATIYYVTALLCGQKRIRIIDFYGTISLSRYPYLILTTIIAITYYLYPEFFQIDISKGHNLKPTLIGTILNFSFMICYVWQIVTYYFAFRESSGLEGKKLLISYIILYLIAELIAMMWQEFHIYIK